MQYVHKETSILYPVTKLTIGELYKTVMVLRDDGDWQLGKIIDFDNFNRVAQIVWDADGHWERKDWVEYPSYPMNYDLLRVLK